MKFKKTDFELKFPAAWLPEARDLAAGRSAWEVEVDNDKIVARLNISAQRSYEIILHQTKKFIFNTHCSCGEFHPARGCVHIPALLYLLNPPSDGLIKIHEKTRFTFEQTLEMLNNEEINDFLRFYIPNNAQFNRHFRQFFEYKFLSGPDMFSAYLEQFTRGLINSSGRKNKTAITDISNIFQIHLFRAQRLFDSAEYVESFNVLKGLLSNAFLLEEKVNFSIFKSEFYQKAHHLLASFYKLDLAPAFQRRISELYVTLVQLPQYKYFDKYNAIDFLSRHPGQLDDGQLEDIFLAKISDEAITDRGPWLYFAFNLENEKPGEKLFLHLQHQLSDIKVLQQVLEFALEQKQIPATLISTVNMIVDRLRPGDLEHPGLQDLLMRFFIRTVNLAQYLVFMDKIFANEGMKESLIADRLHFETATEHPGWKEAIFAHITNPDSPVQEGILLKLYLKAGEYELIRDRIRDTANIQALNTYHQLLHKQGVNMDDTDLTGMIDQYLSDRAGEIVNDQLEKLLKELLFSGFPAKMKLLKTHIQDQYKDRPTLLARINSY